jgi:hypothetical protein
MIWKIWKKNNLNNEMIWKIWKKAKLNSDKIWPIWKKIGKRYGKYGRKVNISIFLPGASKTLCI